ncbi:MAG: hypothetical protein AAGF95_31350 [Chloroflexota bacterium]
MHITEINAPFTIVERIPLPKYEYTEAEMFPDIRFSFSCKGCGTPVDVVLKPFQAGQPLDYLLEKGFVSEEMVINHNVAKPAMRSQKHLGTFVLFNMSAVSFILACDACPAKYWFVSGCGEVQPGRVLCHLSGIWYIALDTTS